MPKRWGVFKRRTPPEDFLFKRCLIVRGFVILFVAFPEVIPVLSVDLSVDEVLFNGVSEHNLFHNQPVEVRVDSRVLSSSKVKSLGG